VIAAVGDSTHGHARTGCQIRRRIPLEIPGAALVILAGTIIASGAASFHAQTWNLWVIYGLLGLSFTFVWGHAGIFSLGQAAFFGVGGYAYGVFAIDVSGHTHETITAVVAGVLIAALFAAAVGYFMFYGNVGDVYLAIITLAVTLVLLTFMSSTADPSYHIGQALLGGYNGMVGVPALTLPGGAAGKALDSNGLLIASIALAAVVGFGVHWLMRRPFGRVLAGLRENELRTQLLGYDVRRYKLLAIAVGGAIAGLAGCLYAAWGTFINPAVFSLQQATLVAIWVLVGGRNSLIGAFVGAAIVQGVSDQLGGSAAGGVIPVVLGSILIAIVLLLPAGIVPTLSSIARKVFALGRGRRTRQLSATPAIAVDMHQNGSGSFANASRVTTSIAARDLRKRFGGVAALDGTTLSVEPNTVHCLIGPNGAGKSTFFNLLSGRYRPTSGEVLLGDEPVTRRRPDERARRGLGIKMQVPCIYLELTVFENVWLAAYADLGDVAAANERARMILAWLHLDSKAAGLASALSHGEQQWLEIGAVMARDPKEFLLDEPTAGMTREETERAVGLINELARSTTVIVVEHDMEFVRQLGAPVTMFHEGRIFTSGTVEELRADERVLDIYLGRGATSAAH
jgi:branched-chain amino acid transport system permease protein